MRSEVSMSYFFVRHARPDVPTGRRRCVGKTDIPLGPLGRMQAYLLGQTLHLPRVYASPLKRAVETASFIGDEVITVPGLEEAYCGEWDGLFFEEIQERWPELYEARGKNQAIEMPGGEPPGEAKARFTEALSRIPDGSVVVAHNIVICEYLGLPPGTRLPYASLIVNGSPSVSVPEMTPELARGLREASGLLPKICLHCDAVAEEALRLAKGRGLDENLIECAAILHDVARLEPEHERIGAEWLRDMGYPEVADVIAQHGTLRDVSTADEAAAVFLADKYMSNTEKVSIDERYDRTAHKCVTPEAMERHEKSRAAAKSVEKLFE